MAFWNSSGVIARFIDSGTETGTPGCDEACLINGCVVGDGLLSGVAAFVTTGCLDTAGDGCAVLGGGFEAESDTTVPPPHPAKEITAIKAAIRTNDR